MTIQTRTAFSAALISLFPFALGCAETESDGASPPSPPAEEVRDSLGEPVGHISSAIIQVNKHNENILLARVEVQPNELVEFYEPKPGVLMVSSAGAPAGPMMIPHQQSSSVETLWDQVSGGAPLPAKLKAALLRSRLGTDGRGSSAEDLDSLPGWGGGSAGPAANPRLEARRQETSQSLDKTLAAPEALLQVNAQSGWCDTGYFNDGWGACPHSPVYSWMFCKDNWWNGAWAQHNDSLSFYTNVCPATGPVTMRLHNGAVNINPASYHVPTNTVRYAWYTDPNCRQAWIDCATVRMDILDASGDRFHWRFEVEPE